MNLHVITAPSGEVSYEADFRAFRKLGGRRIVLRREVTGQVIRDEAEALARYEVLRAAYEQQGGTCDEPTLEYDPRIGPAAVRHLELLYAAAKNAPSTLADTREHLRRLVILLDNARLSEITVPRLEEYICSRVALAGPRSGMPVSSSVIANELSALSALFDRVVGWGLISCNPVGIVRPDWVRERVEAARDWCRPEEASRLLDAAARSDHEARAAREIVRRYEQALSEGRPVERPTQEIRDHARRDAHAEALLTTFVYTGGRLQEVLGLEVEDLSFATSEVRFRDNEYRNLKRSRHQRSVPMWRPLRIVLERHLRETGITSGLIFPGKHGQYRTAIQSVLTRCLAMAGLEEGRSLSCHSMRHTYATLMLRTTVRTEEGNLAERSPDSVARLLGHRTAMLVERVYARDTFGMALREELSFEEARALPATRLLAAPERLLRLDSSAAPPCDVSDDGPVAAPTKSVPASRRHASHLRLIA